MWRQTFTTLNAKTDGFYFVRFHLIKCTIMEQIYIRWFELITHTIRNRSQSLLTLNVSIFVYK